MEYLANFQDSDYTIDDLQLFRGVKQDAVEKALASCPVMRVAEGKRISEISHRSGNLYILLSGELGVLADEETELDESAISVLPGECFGELAVFDEQSGMPSFIARSQSDLLVIDTTRLWKIVDEVNGVARNLLHMLSFRIQAANARLRQRRKVGRFYQQMSMMDGLTGLYNRAWLSEKLPLLVGHTGAPVRALTMIMLDLDHFKRFNDENGHLMGDNALRKAARVMEEALRPTDFAVRYGGEEFMVILPGTDHRSGVTVANRLCTRMRKAVVFDDMRFPLPHITGSFGVASLRAGQDAEAFIAAADKALYRAKNAGRNCVSE